MLYLTESPHCTIMMHVAEESMARPKADSRAAKDRITVTLGPGQHEALQAIGESLNTSLAFVVRFAVQEFLDRHQEQQVELPFPRLPRVGEAAEQGD